MFPNSLLVELIVELRFWIPGAVFRIPKPWIPNSACKIGRIPDSFTKNFPGSDSRIPYMVRFVLKIQILAITTLKKGTLFKYRCILLESTSW